MESIGQSAGTPFLLEYYASFLKSQPQFAHFLRKKAEGIPSLAKGPSRFVSPSYMTGIPQFGHLIRLK